MMQHITRTDTFGCQTPETASEKRKLEAIPHAIVCHIRLAELGGGGGKNL